MQIEFPKLPAPIYARGFSGDSIVTGFHLTTFPDHATVYLENVNTKGKVSNGWTALPADPATLRKVATALESAAAAIEKAKKGEA